MVTYATALDPLGTVNKAVDNLPPKNPPAPSPDGGRAGQCPANGTAAELGLKTPSFPLWCDVIPASRSARREKRHPEGGPRERRR